MRSLYWATIPPSIAAGAASVRWLMQGSGNRYTAVAKRFYVPDPDLGWRVAPGGPMWIGLEAIAICFAMVVGIAIAALIIHRLEKRRRAPRIALRLLLWLGSIAPLAIPVAAFATGMGPTGGRESLPKGATAAAPRAGDGILGKLPIPEGRYEVVAHAGSKITASLAAGGETFEARFARGISGTWTGDPGDLRRPSTVDMRVEAEEVDTGISLRSKHAREEYLHADTYPTIGLRVVRVIAARQDGPAQLAFRASAEVDFLGEKVPTEITGTLRAPDTTARARLGFSASDVVVLADSEFDLSVRGTRLRTDADSFDNDRIQVRASLVFVRRK